MKVIITQSELDSGAAIFQNGFVEAVKGAGESTDAGTVLDAMILAVLMKRYPPSEPMRGLGDMVAKVAQPVARAIDAVAGTKIANCGGCAKRQDALNKAIPFKSKPTQ
ncbi:MAG: hypothetical protein KGL39_56440 [Patescibacteria group bacterium]|nr:hypothetical protein [Patescibacteria group bacterium]